MHLKEQPFPPPPPPYSIAHTLKVKWYNIQKLKKFHQIVKQIFFVIVIMNVISTLFRDKFLHYNIHAGTIDLNFMQFNSSIKSMFKTKKILLHYYLIGSLRFIKKFFIKRKKKTIRCYSIRKYAEYKNSLKEKNQTYSFTSLWYTNFPDRKCSYINMRGLKKKVKKKKVRAKNSFILNEDIKKNLWKNW